jgi:hypothetical protein
MIREGTFVGNFLRMFYKVILEIISFRPFSVPVLFDLIFYSYFALGFDIWTLKIRFNLCFVCFRVKQKELFIF